MKLYYSPAACSLSPHIVSRELGLALDLVQVDTKSKRTHDGRDYLAINPKGYVPALELDNGDILTEGPAIVQYLADRRPDSRLIPANGTIERYHVQEMLGYINSELHKTYTPLFNPNISPETRAERTAYLQRRYALLDHRLADRTYLFGDDFTAPDAYLFVVTNWASSLKVDLSEFGHVEAFQTRVGKRPAVRAAMVAEGLTAKA